MPKRRRSFPKEEEDLFQRLPDSLVEAILCKVGSIKCLLRCEAVCKRWNGICPFVGELVLDCEELPGGSSETLLMERVLSSRMFRVLQVLNARSFGGLPWPSWLTRVSAQLEFLKLETRGLFMSFDPACGRVLPDNVCFQRLVHLSLRGLVLLEDEPSCPMPCLTSCEFVLLCNQMGSQRWVKKFVELSPLLKKMTLEDCSGDLCIASQSLESLVVGGTAGYGCCLEVEAPRLSHLEIQNVEKLVVRGAAALHELVLWRGDLNHIEFCSMPRVSRWIFRRTAGWSMCWTCKEAIRVLESAKDIEIDHVQLPTPVRCDLREPLVNPMCEHLLQSLRELGLSIFDADEN